MAYIPNVVGRKLLRLSVSVVGGGYVQLTFKLSAKGKKLENQNR
jgi:hypothetical protein